MGGKLVSVGYLHIGQVTKQDLLSDTLKFWLPKYPIGPDFGPKWTELGTKLNDQIIFKYFKCASCFDGGFGASHDYKEGPIKKCGCFTDECNVDLYFEINPKDPVWKDFIKNL